MDCQVLKEVRIKQWILAKNNLTGVSSDVNNGYATAEYKWQVVLKETEKAVLVRTVKGDYWFPKSTIVEEQIEVLPTYYSACRQLDNLVEHAEWVAKELGISFSEAITRRCNAIERQIKEYNERKEK